jgi:pSer/pThr/pTyr-binding forkhead associated (FHA) protein
MNLKIGVFGGPMDGKEYIVKQFPATLGRSPDNKLEFPLDEYISDKHCVVFLEDNDIYLADLRSTNGTYVNGTVIQKATVLNSGDTIKIGQTTIKCSI